MLEKIKSAHEPVSRARDDVTDTPHARARDDGTTLSLRARACKICPLLARLMALDRRVEKW